MLKILLKIAGCIILVVSIVIGGLYINHPIVAKWLTGNAVIIGKPIIATIYTDGQINRNISVYKIGKNNRSQQSDNYLLSLKEFDANGMLKYIYVNLNDTWIGRPVSTNKKDYDLINGVLFQSDLGNHFVDFKDDNKGYSFDPHLTFINNKEIEFKVPPNQLKFSDVRILLSKN